MTKKNSPKKVAGVALEPEVIEYLDHLAQKEERSRSWILNRLARDHAERSGFFTLTPRKFKHRANS